MFPSQAPEKGRVTESKEQQDHTYPCIFPHKYNVENVQNGQDVIKQRIKETQYFL